MEIKMIKKLIYDDELINDFEFVERLYVAGVMVEISDCQEESSLIWGDLV